MEVPPPTVAQRAADVAAVNGMEEHPIEEEGVTLDAALAKIQDELAAREYTRLTLTDTNPNYSLATYGGVVALTRQTISNDDLQACNGANVGREEGSGGPKRGACSPQA